MKKMIKSILGLALVSSVLFGFSMNSYAGDIEFGLKATECDGALSPDDCGAQGGDVITKDTTGDITTGDDEITREDSITLEDQVRDLQDRVELLERQ